MTGQNATVAGDPPRPESPDTVTSGSDRPRPSPAQLLQALRGTLGEVRPPRARPAP